MICSIFFLYVSLLEACAPSIIMSNLNWSFYIIFSRKNPNLQRRCGELEEITIGERRTTTTMEEEKAKRSLWCSLGCLVKNAISRTMSISILLFFGILSFAILNFSTCLFHLFTLSLFVFNCSIFIIEIFNLDFILIGFFQTRLRI